MLAPVFSQNNCLKFKSINNVCISIENYNPVKFYQIIESESGGDQISIRTLLEGKYVISHDSLIVIETLTFLSDSLPVVNKNTKYLFLFIQDGIIEAQSSLPGIFNKKDRFYCTLFVFKDGSTLLGKLWENEKLYGKWLYKSKSRDVFWRYYKDGIVEKEEPVILQTPPPRGLIYKW
ncbi:hypothetical protein FACS189434_11490 [Bacteroidia bacterium]|nr:hypothetical protein FACS189434_11490 [Bacteroidia bacterium]